MIDDKEMDALMDDPETPEEPKKTKKKPVSKAGKPIGRPKGSKNKNKADQVIESVTLTKEEKIKILREIAENGTKDSDKITALRALNDIQGDLTGAPTFVLNVRCPCDFCQYNPNRTKAPYSKTKFIEKLKQD